MPTEHVVAQVGEIALRAILVPQPDLRLPHPVAILRPNRWLHSFAASRPSVRILAAIRSSQGVPAEMRM